MEKLDLERIGDDYDDLQGGGFNIKTAIYELGLKLNEVIDQLNNTDAPYNREALLDCLISNKCDKLTARDLVAWNEEERGKQSRTETL